MRKVLIASHGHLASGMKSSIEILFGAKRDDVVAVDGYVDDSDYTPQIQAFVDGIAAADEVLVFTDVLGGSVFQKVMLTVPTMANVFHITNMNLPVVLSCVLLPEGLSRDEIGKVLAQKECQPTLLGAAGDVVRDEVSDYADESFFE